MPLKGRYQFQVSGFHPVVKKTVVPDLLKSGWKHMHQEAADEFFIADSDLPSGFFGDFTPCRKGGLCFCYGKDPAIGDRDLVGIASKIFDGIAKTVKGLFYIRTPVF